MTYIASTDAQPTTILLQLLGGPAGPPGPPNAGVAIKGIAQAWPPATAATVGDLYIVPDPPPAGAPAWAVPGHGAFWDGVDWVDAGALRGQTGARGEPGPPLRVRGEATTWPPDDYPQAGDIWAIPTPVPPGTPPTFHDGGAAAWDDVAKQWIPIAAIRGPAGRSVEVYGPSPMPPTNVTLHKGDMWLATDPSFFAPSFDPAHWSYTMRVRDLADVAKTEPLDGQALVWSRHSNTYSPMAPLAHIEEWSAHREGYPTGAVVHWEGRLWRARTAVPQSHAPNIPDGAATVWTSDLQGRVSSPIFPAYVELQPATLAPTMIATRMTNALTYDVNTGDWRLWVTRPHSVNGHLTFEWTLITPALQGRTVAVGAGSPPFHNGPLQGLLWIYGLPGAPHVPVPVDPYWEPILLGQFLASLADVDMYSTKPQVGSILVFDGLRWTVDVVQFPTGQPLPAIQPEDIGKALVVHSDLTAHFDRILPTPTPADIGHVLEVGPDLRPRWVPRT